MIGTSTLTEPTFQEPFVNQDIEATTPDDAEIAVDVAHTDTDTDTKGHQVTPPVGKPDDEDGTEGHVAYARNVGVTFDS